LPFYRRQGRVSVFVSFCPLLFVIGLKGEAGVPEAFLQRVRREGVFFLFPRPDAEFYWASCLADGFYELGIPVYANFDAYRLREAGRQWLFPSSPMPPSTAAIVVGDISHAEACPAECRRIADFIVTLPQRGALLCMSDSANNFDFPPTVTVLAAHGLARVKRPDRRIAWAFGLNRDVLQKIEAARISAIGQPRKSAFIRNFRPSHNQGVRQVLDLAFVRVLAKHFVIDRVLDEGGRFPESFYTRLATSRGCLAYGGNFFEDLSRNPFFRERRWIVGDDPVVTRWDSWRFWESLASGCLTVALDFDEYGLLLPVSPVNKSHYLGLRFDRLNDTIDFLTGERDGLAEIAERGRHWALTHYSPAPTALRFLSIMAHS
jgi:hypothetical protein